MQAKLLISVAEDGPSFGWIDTSVAAQAQFAEVAERFTVPGSMLILAIDGEHTYDEWVAVACNFQAILTKGWRFLFPGTPAPINAWVNSSTLMSVTTNSNARCRAWRTDAGDYRLTFILNTGTVPVPTLAIRSLIWQLGNAWEWCMLPNRKRLSGRSVFTRETFEAITLHKNPAVLAKPERPQAPEVHPEMPLPEPSGEGEGDGDGEGDRREEF